MANTKALISFAVNAKLICVFVFAYTKSQFSHNEAHINPSFIVETFQIIDAILTKQPLEVWIKYLFLSSLVS